MSEITTIRTVGGLLPPDLLARVVATDRDLAGLKSADYHLGAGETPREAANRAWTYLTGIWTGFRTALDRLPTGDPAVALTREKWLLLLLRELGYGRVPSAPPGGLPIADRTFAISHLWEHTPIHLLGWGVDLDRRTKGVAGAAERAPHALLQEFLNRSDDHLWGIVSNGRTLRLLRDSTNLSGQAQVEFDLETMFDGEVFSDFVILYLLAHQSRVEPLHPDGVATDCWLERWRLAAAQSGTRALGLLRDGVQAAITTLGTGFLRGPSGGDLNRDLAEGKLLLSDYHHTLLRLVYRLLFLFVTEDRGALLAPTASAESTTRYRDYFSTARLRRLAHKRRGTRHGDLWAALTLVIDALGREDGRPELALPGLGGLFDRGDLDFVTDLALPNDALLAAVRHLSVIQLKGQPKRTVDYRNLGAEELGSIYESLLELTPRHDAVERAFTLDTLAGNDRKTSGSYYTPSALIDLVLDEALEPLLDDAEKSATTAAEAEAALLAVTVCDPACGSGHFLVAAARRIAQRLAVVRTGEVDPTPAHLQSALYDVVARCIYGIDINPLAADLAKVSLWLESAQPGRPLTFLDGHIKVGNALLGATPALIAGGIPDAAYAPIEGDDKKAATSFKKRNRAEREAAQFGLRQDGLFDHGDPTLGNARLRGRIRGLAPGPVPTLADVHLAQARLRALADDPALRNARQVADTWCAAFVQPKAAGAVAITHDTLRAVEAGQARADVTSLVEDITARYRFFHWHLEFPEIFEVPEAGAETATGWLGGFSCLLGNPPWERVKLQEQEFFASRDLSIAGAPNAAARKKLIAALPDRHPPLWREWSHARRAAEGESHLLRSSGRYPLTGRGDVNTYSVFAETMRAGIALTGRAGIITPTGLATDATTAPFFADALSGRRLAAFYDFENEAKIFAGVDHRVRFAVTCLTGGEPVDRVRMAFVVRHIADVPSRRFDLQPEEVLILNPNTGTLPVFRSRTDAEITLRCYRRHPILIRDGLPDGNPWGLSFCRLFDMANDSGLFCTADDLRGQETRYEGWAWRSGDQTWLPLYEAKLLGHWDHRLSTYEGATQAQLNVGSLPRLADADHDDPRCEPLARYWVAEQDVTAALRERWDRGWLFGWRKIARASDARTMVPAAIPLSAAGDSCMFAFSAAPFPWILQAVWSSFAFDYLARQKVSGTNFQYYILNQLACPPPAAFERCPAWESALLGEWMRPRVFELAYTSHRIAPYARDVLGLPGDADPGPPFRWIPQRRERLRAELDAAMLHLYGLARLEVEHVLDSFPVVRKYEERDHGEFRTKRLVLEIFDAMSKAAERGTPYRTMLDPVPGHGPRHPAGRESWK
jgi:hypothetical protein